MVAWFALWVLYQSIVEHRRARSTGSAGSRSCWRPGFLAIFLGNDATAPPWLVILAFRWLAFRVEFGAGLIKLRGDRVLARA